MIGGKPKDGDVLFTTLFAVEHVVIARREVVDQVIPAVVADAAAHAAASPRGRPRTSAAAENSQRARLPRIAPPPRFRDVQLRGDTALGAIASKRRPDPRAA